MRILVLGALALALVSGCGGGGDDAPASHAVVYSIGGTAASASLTYASTGGGTSQKTVTLPATVVEFFKDGEFLYISAQNQTSSGTVRVSIETSGRVLKSSTSSGAFAIATASTTCC